MILINKNTTTKNILTLSEKTTLLNAVYLFEVINDTTNVTKCFIAQDISGNKPRCNTFDFIENATESLLIGTFSLPTGDYKYNVYEQVSGTNLDPLLALNKIDLGKLLVKEIETPIAEFTATQETYKIYNGI